MPTPDPLLERFEELERAVALRERLARQAACPHERTVDFTVFGGPRQAFCEDCGAVVEAA